MRTNVYKLGLLGVLGAAACSPAAPEQPYQQPGPAPVVTGPVAPIGPGTQVVPVNPTAPVQPVGVNPNPTGVAPVDTSVGVNPTPTGVNPTPTGVNPTPTGVDPGPVQPGPAECTGSKDTIGIAANGWVPAECNNFGINGAWYCYDDGVNPSGCTADAVPFDATKVGMCLKGNTTEDPDFLAWGAGIGFSLNVVDDVKTAWNATSNHVIGFKIKIEGDTGDLPLRVSYKNEASEDETPPMKELPGPDEYTILFDDAAVPSWADESIAGNPPNPEALYDIQIQVAGGAVADDYDFCITELTPITDGTTPEPGGVLQTYGQPQAGQYDTITVGPYVVQNNRYGSNTHSIQALSDGANKAGFVLSGLSANVATGSAPGSYPSIMYGWHVDGIFHGAYQTAKTIGAITSIPTTAKYTASGGTGYNASYDLWISGQANPGANGPRTEMMVWLGFLSTTPIGTQQTTVDIGGTSWVVWYDDDIGEDGFHTVSYIRSQNTRDATLDLKAFLDDSVTRGYMQASEYVLGVQFGFEIWQADSSHEFSVDEYSVSIN